MPRELRLDSEIGPFRRSGISPERLQIKEGLTMEEKTLEFHGGWTLSLLPMVLFIIACTSCFVVLHVFDMNLLSMCAFLAIIIGGVFAKNYETYWSAVIKDGIGSEMAVTIFAILLVISMFAKLMAQTAEVVECANVVGRQLQGAFERVDRGGIVAVANFDGGDVAQHFD